MLRKLIKNEFRAVNRLMAPLHLTLIAITVVGRFYVQFVMSFYADSYDSYAVSGLAESTLYLWRDIMNVLLVIAYVIALIAIALVTVLYLNVLRPRNNLFTDEGYLMHTLPVTEAQLIWSKLVVAVVWQLVDGALIALSVFAMFANASVVKFLTQLVFELINGFPTAFGIPAPVGIPLYLFMFLLELVAGILLIYMCIAVGHSFNSHRAIASVCIYIGAIAARRIVSSVISLIVTGINYINGSNYGFNISLRLMTGGAWAGSFWAYWGLTTLLYAVQAVAAFLIARYFMTSRLNLE